MFDFIFLVSISFLSFESKSKKLIVSDSDKTIKDVKKIDTTNEVADLFGDSIKIIQYSEFQLLFTQFNQI